MQQTEITSLPALFLSACADRDFPGWYRREGDSWIHYPPASLRARLLQLTLALNKHGLCAGKSLGIIAKTSPAWMLADLAAQTCHATTVPLFPNIAPEHFLFQCEDANIEYLVIDDLASLNHIFLPLLKRFKLIVCILATSRVPRENGIRWEDLLYEGEILAKEEGVQNWFDYQVVTIRLYDIFSIIYTSGSTGRPKGAELSHRNMLTQLGSISKLFPLSPKKDKALTILPVAHVFERMVLYYYIAAKTRLYFGDDPRNTAQLLHDVRPTIFTVVPRLLERLYEKMTAEAENASGFRHWFLRRAIRSAKIRKPQKRKGPFCKLFDFLVYRRMRAAIGDNFKYIVSGSSALNKSILRFLHNIGLPIYEGYGLTECAPVVSVNSPEHWKPGSVGRPLTHLKVKIGEQNEVLVKGASVFHEYHNMPQMNVEAFTEDGYFRTGDQGAMDKDGYIFLTGRIKEIFKTSTGKYVSPAPIELELSRLPLIEGALVIANNRKFVSALIFLNVDYAKRFLTRAEKRAEKPFFGTATPARIKCAIENHIRNVNKKLNQWEKIQKWTLITDPLTVESGLLTPTFKLRRHACAIKYATVIEKLYAPAKEKRR
ncbi:MAG: long-chain fatty acid--CoA ligase [Fibrobacteraceae bacterium]